MQVVLYTDGEFSGENQRKSVLAWAQEFARETESLGTKVVFFDPSQSKLQPTDIIHVFGYSNLENWYWLKKLSAAVVVSPFPSSELPAPAFALPLFTRLVHRLRKALRPKKEGWYPLASIEAVDKFCPLPPSPAAAALKMNSIYASLRREN
jgi:hypothetical protein